MKRIFCILICICIMLVNFPLVALADDATEEIADYFDSDSAPVVTSDGCDAAQRDDNGYYISGGYLYLEIYNTTDNHTHQFYLNEDIYGEKMYVTYSSSSPIGYYVQNWSSRVYTYWWYNDNFALSMIYDHVTYTNGNCGMNLVSDNQVFLTVVTNLPVFDVDDEDAINAYLETGSTDGAINQDELDKIDAEMDETVSRTSNFTCINSGDFSANDDGKLLVGNVQVGWLPEAGSYDLSLRGYFYLYNTTLDIDWASLISGAAVMIGGVAAKDVTGTAGGIAAAVSAFGTSDSLVNTGWGSWGDLSTVSPGDTGKSCVYTISTTGLQDYITNYLSSISGCDDYFFSKLEIRVRHRVGTACSLWDVITIDYTDGSVESSVRDDNGVEYDNSDSSSDSSADVDVTVGGSDIVINIENNNDNDNTNKNTNTNNVSGGTDAMDSLLADTSADDASSGIDWSFTDLFTMLKNGLGLLGDDGIVALLGAVFSFLPSEIFVIITLGVTVAVVILIVNLIKRLFD